MVTGGSSHRKAARHFSFAEDAQINRYVRAVSLGWADVHLSAHRCVCRSAVFVDFSHLAGILPVVALIV